MCKRILCLLLCIVMVLSFSMDSYADIINDLKAFETVGEIVYFGHYEQDNDLSNGKEPIEWVVLDVQEGKSLLMSKFLIDAQPYNVSSNAYTWKDCSLRKWLNTEFYSTAFSDSEKKYIIETDVDNSEAQDYSWWSKGGSANTQDFVFALSYAEIVAYMDLTDQNDNKVTSYAREKLLSHNQHYRKEDKTAYWWGRSPGPTVAEGMLFPIWKGSGPIRDHLHDYHGVRPTIWIDSEALKENPVILETTRINAVEEASDIKTEIPLLFEELNWDEATELTTLGGTTWKMWLPDGFVADELTEADLAENYIGYYLRDDDIIAVQYYDNTYSLADWQKELVNRGFTVKGLYQINGAEALLYQNEEEDFLTASVLDGKGKLLEVSFFPYSKMAEEADTVISSIQQETSRRKLSGAGGNTKATSDSATTAEPAGNAFSSQEEAYKAMVDAYKAGNYSDSYSYYEQAKEYQDADKYGNLLKARLCYDLKLKDSEIESLEKAIVSDIDFADSKDVLVCNPKLAHYYLLGYWRTSNGMHGYEVSPDWYSNTTVPAIPKSGDYYTIMDGTYWSYFDGKWDDRVAQYKFTPISKSKMEMYSYQAKQSYTFSKIR